MWLLMIVTENKEKTVMNLREFRKYVARMPLNNDIVIRKVLSLEFKSSCSQGEERIGKEAQLKEVLGK